MTTTTTTTDTCCPDLETLSAWIDGWLPRLEQDAIDRHLARCGTCRDLVVNVRDSLDAVAGADGSWPWRVGFALLLFALFALAAALRG